VYSRESVVSEHEVQAPLAAAPTIWSQGVHSLTAQGVHGLDCFSLYMRGLLVLSVQAKVAYPHLPFDQHSTTDGHTDWMKLYANPKRLSGATNCDSQS
jgi:hypothetical protein